eukprot:Opistho-2@57745
MSFGRFPSRSVLAPAPLCVRRARREAIAASGATSPRSMYAGHGRGDPPLCACARYDARATVTGAVGSCPYHRCSPKARFQSTSPTTSTLPVSSPARRAYTRIMASSTGALSCFHLEICSRMYPRCSPLLAALATTSARRKSRPAADSFAAPAICFPLKSANTRRAVASFPSLALSSSATSRFTASIRNRSSPWRRTSRPAYSRKPTVPCPTDDVSPAEAPVAAKDASPASSTSMASWSCPRPTDDDNALCTAPAPGVIVQSLPHSAPISIHASLAPSSAEPSRRSFERCPHASNSESMAEICSLRQVVAVSADGM